jgi:hypothetical protein
MNETNLLTDAAEKALNALQEVQTGGQIVSEKLIDHIIAELWGGRCGGLTGAVTGWNLYKYYYADCVIQTTYNNQANTWTVTEKGKEEQDVCRY